MTPWSTAALAFRGKQSHDIAMPSRTGRLVKFPWEH